MAGQYVAFDIGEAQVKIVSFAGGKVKKAVSEELPDRLVAGGEILSMDAMGDFLKEVARKNGIGRGTAGVILPGSLVFTRNVTVPPMTDAQLAYNLPFEFKDYLTEEKSKYFFDYAVDSVKKKASGDPEEMDLFACATLKHTIEEYREMFRRAGFRLRCAIPEEAAYAAMLENYGKAHPDSADRCIADIGHRGTRLYMYRGSRFRTKRTVELGLFDLEQKISDEKGVDIHMAHTHLMTDYQDVLSEDSSRELYNRMAVEIMKAVNFYNYNNREQSLREIYLCGGGTAVAPLQEAIRQVTDLDVHPVTELLPDTGSEEPWLFARAVGCGLEM